MRRRLVPGSQIAAARLKKRALERLNRPVDPAIEKLAATGLGQLPTEMATSEAEPLVTDEDREKAAQALADELSTGRDAIAAALAEERERARAPFLALADEFAAEAEELGWARGAHYEDAAERIRLILSPSRP